MGINRLSTAKIIMASRRTFSLNSVAFQLGIVNPYELLYFVATKPRPLGPGRLYIPNHGNPLLMRFTEKQIRTIKRRLKNYHSEPLDFEAIDKAIDKVLQNAKVT